jgi:hypothetical protein
MSTEPWMSSSGMTACWPPYQLLVHPQFDPSAGISAGSNGQRDRPQTICTQYSTTSYTDCIEPWPITRNSRKLLVTATREHSRAAYSGKQSAHNCKANICAIEVRAIIEGRQFSSCASVICRTRMKFDGQSENVPHSARNVLRERYE